MKKKGPSGGGQFVPIPYPLAKSAAWRSLSGPAVKVYVELRSRFNGGNNGDLTLSLDEAARLLKLGKHTVTRALNELQEKGFITMTKRGSWYGRKATEWAVSDRMIGKNPPTNNWRRWRSDRAENPALGAQMVRRTR